MSLTDVALPVLGFILIIIPLFSLKRGLSIKEKIELFIGVLIMGFSIWSYIENSGNIDELKDSNHDLVLALDEVKRGRQTDSLIFDNFQKYVKDTFGIEVRDGKPVINNITQYVSKVSAATSSSTGFENTPDSINYVVKFIGNTLYISPKQSTWVHGYVAFDTSMPSGKFLNEGMGTPRSVDYFKIDGKTYNTHQWKMYDRAVHIDEPIKLNLAGYKDAYVIFGDEGIHSKRYIWKNQVVKWVPF